MNNFFYRFLIQLLIVTACGFSYAQNNQLDNLTIKDSRENTDSMYSMFSSVIDGEYSDRNSLATKKADDRVVNIAEKNTRQNTSLHKLTPAQIREISPSIFQEIPAPSISLLSSNQTSAITPAQIRSLRREQVMQLRPTQIKEFFMRLDIKDFNNIYSQLTGNQLRNFIVMLPPNEVGDLPIHMLTKLDIGVFPAMSNQQFNALREEQLLAFTTNQVNSFTNDQLYWSYKKLVNGMVNANFIRLLNKERIVDIIKYLPKEYYRNIFNSTNPLVLVDLIKIVNDDDKEFILSQLDQSMLSEIYHNLPEKDVIKLKPEQKTFLASPDIQKIPATD